MSSTQPIRRRKDERAKRAERRKGEPHEIAHGRIRRQDDDHDRTGHDDPAAEIRLHQDQAEAKRDQCKRHQQVAAKALHALTARQIIRHIQDDRDLEELAGLDEKAPDAKPAAAAVAHDAQPRDEHQHQRGRAQPEQQTRVLPQQADRDVRTDKHAPKADQRKDPLPPRIIERIIKFILCPYPGAAGHHDDPDHDQKQDFQRQDTASA